MKWIPVKKGPGPYQILMSWAKYNIEEYKDAESFRDDTLFSSGEFSGIVENSKNLIELLKEIRDYPERVIKRGREEGWLK